MKNLKTQVQLIGKALAMLPEGHVYDNARIYLRRALNEISDVETKKSKKAHQPIVEKKWNFDWQKGIINNPFIVKEKMEIIDGLIKEQEDIIAGIKQKKESDGGGQMLND